MNGSEGKAFFIFKNMWAPSTKHLLLVFKNSRDFSFKQAMWHPVLFILIICFISVQANTGTETKKNSTSPFLRAQIPKITTQNEMVRTRPSKYLALNSRRNGAPIPQSPTGAGMRWKRGSSPLTPLSLACSVQSATQRQATELAAGGAAAAAPREQRRSRWLQSGTFFAFLPCCKVGAPAACVSCASEAFGRSYEALLLFLFFFVSTLRGCTRNSRTYMYIVEVRAVSALENEHPSMELSLVSPRPAFLCGIGATLP